MTHPGCVYANEERTGVFGALVVKGRPLVTLPPLRPSRVAVAVAALLAWPAAVAAAQAPDASFRFSPADPRAGQEVRFESSSCDPDGRLVS